MEKRNSSEKTYETIAVIVTGLVVVFLFLGSKYPGLLYAAVATGVPAILSRRIAYLIYRLWMGLANILGKVMPVILLSVLFFLVLTPLAWLRRLSGRSDNLHLKDTENSLYTDHTRTFDKAYFEKTW